MENKTYIFEGKTTNEAIEKGLKELKVSKNRVEIKVLEQEEKRSFFSILAPRIVKVEMKLKEEVQKNNFIENKKEKESNKKSLENIDEIKTIVESFLNDFLSKMPGEKMEYKVEILDGGISIDITGQDTGFLIGYRGEVLNSIQAVLTNIVNKNSKDKIKVMLNIGGYREKREKDLENLAMKIASSVVKTGKNITLEPMTAYERKIIHTKLQTNNKVKTYSVGEEPRRKVVVALNK